MTIYALECEMIARKSLGSVFEVFENPHNLARITPPWLSFRVTSKEPVKMRTGAEIEYTIRWLGIPMYWRTLIREYEPPHLFVDEQAAGPYALWRHRHTFVPTEEGVRVGDRVEYALPLGVLGTLAHRVVVERQLKRIFNYRQARLREIFGGEATITRLPAVRSYAPGR